MISQITAKKCSTHLIGISSFSLLSFWAFQHSISFDIWTWWNCSSVISKEEIRIKYLKWSPCNLFRSSTLIRLRFENPLSHSTLEPGRTAKIWQSLKEINNCNKRERPDKIWVYVRSDIQNILQEILFTHFFHIFISFMEEIHKFRFKCSSWNQRIELLFQNFASLAKEFLLQSDSWSY